MSGSLRLLGIGVLPLLAGLLFHFILCYLPIGGFLLCFMNLVLLLLWGYGAYRAADAAKSPVIQALALSAFGLLMLALALWQELVLWQYWPNFIGFGTQLYFLPFLTLASTLVTPFSDVVRVWPMYILIWVWIFLISFIGCRLKRRKGAGR